MPRGERGFLVDSRPDRYADRMPGAEGEGWGESRVSFFHDRLEAFPRLADYRLAKAAGYWPYYKTVESASRPRFTIEGQDYINFGSNNYLSLSYHPRVIEAAQAATRSYGTGVTGSRLLNGTLDLHRTLEAELADFYGREAALVFSTGYVANVSTIAGLLNRHDYACSTRTPTTRCSPAPSSRARRMKRFAHNDVDRLAQDPRRAARRRRARRVIVDGVYSMGGDTAPLAGHGRARAAAHPNTFLLDDEAHGLGVLGERGRGAAEHLRRPRRRRPHHDHVLEDARLVRRRAHRLGRRHRAAHARRRHAHLHRVEHARLGRGRARRRSASCATTPTMTGRLRDNVDLFVGLLTERGVPVNPAESAIITIPLRQARRGVGGGARPRAARGGRLREPGGRAGGAAGPRPHPPEPDARPHARPPRRGGRGRSSRCSTTTTSCPTRLSVPSGVSSRYAALEAALPVLVTALRVLDER